MSEHAFDPTPPSPGTGATLAAGLVAVAATAIVPPAAVLVLGGALLMPVGVRRGERRVHAVGALAAVAGVLLGALAGSPAPLVLAGTVAALLAWDVGEHAIGLGEQVGRRAEGRRAVLVHAAASAAMAVVIVVGSVVVYRLARQGQGGAAAVLLAGAAAVLALLLDW